MLYYQLSESSYHESLKALEADIQLANVLAAKIPLGKSGSRLQMKLAYNNLAPVLLFLLQWIDCSCSCLLPKYLNLFHVLVYKVYADGRPNLSTLGRKASIGEFYGVILPSLQRFNSSVEEVEDPKMGKASKSIVKKRNERDLRFSNTDLEREDECGICLEPCTKMVLPNCCHAMCIKCYRKWNMKSESCPFCRGSIRRVKSEDLWVLTCDDEVVDAETVCREDLLRFYLYINNLPKDYPDALFVLYYEYLF